MVWYGRILARDRLLRRGAVWLLPGIAWLALLLVLPLAALGVLVFLRSSPIEVFELVPTLENVKQVAGIADDGWDSTYLVVAGRTLWISVVTTVACLVLAFPIAMFLATRPRATRTVWLALVALPICTNIVVRCYSWALVLHRDLPLAALARAAGLLDADSGLSPSSLAVYLGLVSSSLPFAVLPLYASVERMDWTLVEAARDLGASPAGVFVHAVLPQTLGGLGVAAVFVLVPTLGAYVVTDLLGGAKHMLLGNVIAQQFGTSNNWPLGATMSLALTAMTLVALLVYRRAQGRRRAA
jgi:spermidine/putrescine transport system permease protein